MNLYIKTHTVKKWETLEQITEMYNIPEVEMLRYFHNQNAPKDHNHIGSIVFAGQEILIPQKDDIDKIISQRKSLQTENRNQKIRTLENSRLLPVFTKINHNYAIKITDIQKKTTIQDISEFDVLLQYLSKDQEDHHIISYHKKNLTVNGEAPQLKIYELAQQCITCLYPIELKIDTKGNLTGIHNYKKIYNAWLNEKQKLQHLYEDEYSLQYIKTFDDIISHSSNLMKCMKRDLFLQFYFSCYTQYENAQSVTENRFQRHRILYQNTYDMTFDEMIHIKQKSECTDTRDQQEILAHLHNDTDKNEETAHKDAYLLESAISGNYSLNKEDKILRNAVIEIESFFYNTEEIIQIDISTL